MVINRYMFDKHLNHASYHLTQAEMWLGRGDRVGYMLVQHHIKLAKAQIVMAKLYVGWHPKLAENYDA